MPRYLVERTFEEVFALPLGVETAAACAAIVATNARDEVTWIHSYVSTDGQRLFCVYDAPSPEAVRHAARANHLPVARVTEVRVLDPYGYTAVFAGRTNKAR